MVVYQSLHVFLDRIHSFFVAVFLQLSELFDVILKQVLIKSMEFLLHPFLDKLMVVLRGFLYAILVVLNELLV